MEKFYRTLIKRAVGIAWRFKWLWPFGFFSMFLMDQNILMTIIQANVDLSQGRTIFFTLREQLSSNIFGFFSWTRLMDQLATDPAAFTMSVFSMMIITAFISVFIVLAVISQGGLIKSSVALDLKKKVTFSQAFKLGIDKFWPVLTLNFIILVLFKGVIMAIALLVSVLVTFGSTLAFIVYGIAFILILLIAVVTYLMTIYASAFVVLRDKNVWSALRLAWYVFHQNLLLNLEVAVIQIGLYILAVIVGLLVTILIVSPLVVAYILMVIMSATTGLIFLWNLIFILFVGCMTLFLTFYSTLQVTLWSLLFEELALKRATSKTERVVHAIVRHVQKQRA